MNEKITMWGDPSKVEPQAMEQLERTAALPWTARVAVMPDVHYGKGATVGSVVAMRGAVAPAAVGVDIGCGMGAVQVKSWPANWPLPEVRATIERAVPVGFNARQEPHPDPAVAVVMAGFRDRFPWLEDRDAQALEHRAVRQLGTLGGGNHFIEVCLDPLGQPWVMVHSGSRNVGKRIADHHCWVAREQPHNAGLPDPDLSVLLEGSDEFDAYLRDMRWAVDYARLNRILIVQEVLRALGTESVGATGWCCHNYVEEEVHFGERLLVTRKGAIQAGLGQLGIIPGSMGTRSYVVRGKGCAASMESASHGAGRAMSRGAAKRRFGLTDLAAQTDGVECRKDEGVLDEIPGAYKPIDEVMEAQRDLVEIVTELRAIICVKG